MPAIHEDSLNIVEDLLNGDTVYLLEADEYVPIMFSNIKLNHVYHNIKHIVEQGGKVLSVRRDNTPVYVRQGEHIVTETRDNVEVFVDAEWEAGRNKELLVLRDMTDALRKEPRVFVNIFAGDGILSTRLNQLLSMAANWRK